MAREAERRQHWEEKQNEKKIETEEGKNKRTGRTRDGEEEGDMEREIEKSLFIRQKQLVKGRGRKIAFNTSKKVEYENHKMRERGRHRRGRRGKGNTDIGK